MSYMKNLDEIIGRTECLLCIVDRCGIENEYSDGIYHSWFEREKQRGVIFNWMKDNDYVKYMTETEKSLFKKIVGNPFLKRVFQEKHFEREAIEPLLWSLGIVKRLTSYDRYVLTDFHKTLNVHVPDTHKVMLEKAVLRSEEEITFQDDIAMLWHWRAIEGRNPIFKKESIKDMLLDIFGEYYKDAINKILSRQKKKQDFMIGDKYVYELNSTEVSHLFMRTKWRYHAFEWLLTDDAWDDVQLNT